MTNSTGPIPVDAGAVPLENNANKVTPPFFRREKRYRLRGILAEFSQVKRCRGCGRWMTGEVVGVRYSVGSGAGFSGLQTCGSVWVCPVCSAKILARRSVEMGVLLLGWENLGGQHVMGTLTMRHHRGHSLAQEWEALSAAWKSIQKCAMWRKWRNRLGSPGLVRVVEVTYGDDNGWHVHLHFVLLVSGDCTPSDVQEFSDWLVPKWERCLASAGMPGALPIGQEVHLVGGVEAASQLGDYLTKQTAYGTAESLGRELFGTVSKQARSSYSTEPVWRLVEEFAETGDLELLGLFHEYEKVSHGKRQFGMTRGLRELLALGPEKSDEEIAAEEAGDRDLVQITRAGWMSVLRSEWSPVQILEVMEAEGVAGVCRFLEAEGIEHMEVHEDGRAAKSR